MKDNNDYMEYIVLKECTKSLLLVIDDFLKNTESKKLKFNLDDEIINFVSFIKGSFNNIIQ